MSPAPLLSASLTEDGFVTSSSVLARDWLRGWVKVTSGQAGGSVDSRVQDLTVSVPCSVVDQCPVV